MTNTPHSNKLHNKPKADGGTSPSSALSVHSQQTKKQIVRFLVAGFTAVGVDALTYVLFLHVVNASIAKGLSFLTGTVVAYFINKLWTFEQKEHSSKQVLKFAVLYASTLGANVLVNAAVMWLFSDFVFVKGFAFLAATGTSTVLNFIGQKWWVFKA